MHGFFYGNWFIGLCAVALGVEAAMQQEVPLNGAWYHVLVFLACVVLSVILVQRLQVSRVGRAWAAIRDDEHEDDLADLDL